MMVCSDGEGIISIVEEDEILFPNISFPIAIYKALVRLGCLQGETTIGNFYSFLANMVQERDEKLFDVLNMVLEDAKEIALVLFAESTAIFTDRYNTRMNFWDETHWSSKNEFHTALQIVARSGYALDVTRQAAQKILAPNPGMIYLLSCEEGYYKIGRSRDVNTRLTQFHTIPPFEFKLEHTIIADDYVEAEAVLHHRFADRRIRGEWFKLEKNDLQLIKSLSEYQRGEFTKISVGCVKEV